MRMLAGRFVQIVLETMMNPNELSADDRAAINRLIAEATGWTTVARKMGAPPGYFGDRQYPIPDFCGSDAAAVGALVALQLEWEIQRTWDELDKCWRYKIQIYAKRDMHAGDASGKWICGTRRGRDGLLSIAVALVDATVEQTDEDLIGQRPDVLHKTEKVWRLKSALKAALREDDDGKV